MIRYYFLLLCSLAFCPVRGQVYQTAKAVATFGVKAPAKTIEGESRKVNISIDSRDGAVRLQVPVKSFEFHNNFIADTMNAVIRSRFSSYYLESELYPDVIYTCSLPDSLVRRLREGGSYPFRTAGKLLLHGVTHDVSTEGTMAFRADTVTVKATMTVQPLDYGIRIPPYIGSMYFRQVDIHVHGVLTRR